MLFEFRLLAPTAALFLIATAVAADPPSKSVSIDVSELNCFAGSWEGYMEYLDYSDDKKKTRLPTTVRYELGKDSVKYVKSFTEPNGSTVDDQGTIRPINDGTKLFFDGRSHRILAKEIDQQAKTFRIVLTNTGKDNKQPATFTTTILCDKSILTITKQVKYEGQDSPFVRNEYSLQRVK